MKMNKRKAKIRKKERWTNSCKSYKNKKKN